MIAPALFAVILASASADPGPDVAPWIERLGAEAFDDRVAAYKAIEQLGPAALPALNAAADTGDPRVRSRVRALIASIGRQAESDRLTQPTLVRLDFHERPLGEIIDALNGRYDLGLSLQLGPPLLPGLVRFDPQQPERLKALRDRSVTLEAPEPLPYWEAVDRLCKAATLRYDASSRPTLGAGPGALALIADELGRVVASDSGPFRVQITSVWALLERDFLGNVDAAPKGANEPDGGELTLALDILPEPGLRVHPNGPVLVAEAVDDRGRSIVPPAPARVDAPPPPYRAPFNSNNAPVRVFAKLLAPDPPGTVIRRVRGKVPVAVVTRRADPIIVRLGDVVTEKWIETPDLTFIVDEVSLAPGSRASVRVTIRPKRLGNFTARTPGRRPANFAAFDRDRVLEQFEFRNAAGKKLSLGTNGMLRGADARGFYDRYQLLVAPPGQGRPTERGDAANAPIPSELRYYELVQSTTEIPFDFRDIPMP